MRTLSRYTFQEYLKVFLLTLCAFSIAYLSIDLIDKTKKVVEHNAEMILTLQFLAFKLPKALFDVTPLAILFATLLTLGNFSRHHEITAMKSCGINPLKATLPVLFFAFSLSFFFLFLGGSFLPLSLRHARFIKDVLIEKKPREADFRGNRLWIRGEGRTFLNIQLVDVPQKALYGVHIYKIAEDFTLPEEIEAREVTFLNNQWIVASGIRRKFFPDGTIKVESIENEVYPLNKTPEEFAQLTIKEDEMKFSELTRYVNLLTQDGYGAARYAVKLEEKISLPFVNFIMALLGIPLSLREGGRPGLARGVGVSLVIGISFWVVHYFSLALGKSGLLPPIAAAWMANSIFLLFGLSLFLSVRQ